jgi:uncharacterized membrane protein (DUF485 family)
VTEERELQKRVRRNALLLALLALGFYVAFFAVQLVRGGG